jgi:hypothetical protein
LGSVLHSGPSTVVKTPVGETMEPVEAEDYQLEGTCRGNTLIATIAGTGNNKAPLHGALCMARHIKDNHLKWGVLKILSPGKQGNPARRYQTACDASIILRKYVSGGLVLVPDDFLPNAKFFAVVCSNLGLRMKAFSLARENEVMADLASAKGPITEFLSTGLARKPR